MNSPFMGFSFWRRAGWLRWWVTASVCWIIFAGYKTAVQWDLPTEEVTSQPVYGADRTQPALGEALKEAEETCVNSTIRGRVFPDPVPSAPLYWEEDTRLGVAQRAGQYGGSSSREIRQIVLQPIADKYSVSLAEIESNPKKYGVWPAQPSDKERSQASKRADRIAASDFHTHWLVVDCERESAAVKELRRAVAPTVFPPIVVLILGWFGTITLPRLGRWEANGFRRNPLPPSDQSPTPTAERVPNQPPAEPAASSRQPKGLFKMAQLVGLGFAMLDIIVLSNRASAWTKRLIAGWRDAPSENVLRRFEREARAELPKRVGPDIFAVDVSADETGLRWTYQSQPVNGTISRKGVDAFMADIASKACSNAAVHDIVIHGFHVTYDLIGPAGEALASHRADKC